jgi:hypothetical protein
MEVFSLKLELLLEQLQWSQAQENSCDTKIYSWLSIGTYHKNLTIWKCFYFIKIWKFWAIFSMESHLYG